MSTELLVVTVFLFLILGTEAGSLKKSEHDTTREKKEKATDYANDSDVKFEPRSIADGRHPSSKFPDSLLPSLIYKSFLENPSRNKGYFVFLPPDEGPTPQHGHLANQILSHPPPLLPPTAPPTSHQPEPSPPPPPAPNSHQPSPSPFPPPTSHKPPHSPPPPPPPAPPSPPPPDSLSHQTPTSPPPQPPTSYPPPPSPSYPTPPPPSPPPPPSHPPPPPPPFPETPLATTTSCPSEDHPTCSESFPLSSEGCQGSSMFLRRGESEPAGEEVCGVRTCRKFGGRYHLEEQKCNVIVYNPNYTCIVLADKTKPYPQCCPQFRCDD